VPALGPAPSGPSPFTLRLSLGKWCVPTEGAVGTARMKDQAVYGVIGMTYGSRVRSTATTVFSPAATPLREPPIWRGPSVAPGVLRFSQPPGSLLPEGHPLAQLAPAHPRNRLFLTATVVAPEDFPSGKQVHLFKQALSPRRFPGVFCVWGVALQQMLTRRSQTAGS
jgi:hypothetical protein